MRPRLFEARLGLWLRSRLEALRRGRSGMRLHGGLRRYVLLHPGLRDVRRRLRLGHVHAAGVCHCLRRLLAVFRHALLGAYRLLRRAGLASRRAKLGRWPMLLGDRGVRLSPARFTSYRGGVLGSFGRAAFDGAMLARRPRYPVVR